MKLSTPKVVTFWIAFVLGALGIIGQLVSTIPFVSAYSVWLLAAGFILLLLSVVFKGL